MCHIFKIYTCCQGTLNLFLISYTTFIIFGIFDVTMFMNNRWRSWLLTHTHMCVCARMCLCVHVNILHSGFFSMTNWIFFVSILVDHQSEFHLDWFFICEKCVFFLEFGESFMRRDFGLKVKNWKQFKQSMHIRKSMGLIHFIHICENLLVLALKL